MAKTSGVGYVPVDLAGDKMEGYLELNADPVDPLDAATKQYVDGGFEDFDFKNSCYAATTANLTATYDNGTDNDGVGATLTNNDTQAVFAIDGVSPPLGSRVLIKDQTNEFENGIYVVSDVGSVSTDWVLERAVDFDGVLKVRPGNFVVINNGTDNTQTAWLQTEEVVDIGTDDILFVGFGGGDSPLVLLATANVGVAAATVDFNNILSSEFDDYIVIFERLSNQTNAVSFLMQFGTGSGPTYQTSDYISGTLSTIGAIAFAGPSTAIGINASARISNTITHVGAGTINIYDANSASGPSTSGTFFFNDSGGSAAGNAGSFGGRWNQNSTGVTSLRFFFSSGNVSGARFTIYGLRR